MPETCRGVPIPDYLARVVDVEFPELRYSHYCDICLAFDTDWIDSGRSLDLIPMFRDTRPGREGLQFCLKCVQTGEYFP